MMFQKIFIIIIGIIVAIPVLLWFAIRGILTGSWKLLGFVCQRQYRELKRLCECGTADELKAFLTAHPGAMEYIVYTRKNRATSLITTLFRLPAPLAVAGQANNLAVIPLLLANGASPEVRSVSARQSPAEESIGNPEKMRALCNGKTWWQENTAQNEALEEGIKEQNCRGIVWNVMRGARLEKPEQLWNGVFLCLPVTMKEFVCRFGIDDKRREEFYSHMKRLTPEEVRQITSRRVKAYASGIRNLSRQEEFDEMVHAMEKALQPLPSMEDDAMDRLMFSAGLMDRTKMLELLDNLFTMEQQFALLKQFTATPSSQEDRELTEDAVDLLLCSILKKAED